MENKILNATVIKDGRNVMVYKLSDGRYNIYLGEEMSISKVEQKAHAEIFEPNELKIN